MAIGMKECLMDFKQSYIYIFSFSRHFYPKRLTNVKYNKRFIEVLLIYKLSDLLQFSNWKIIVQN